MASVSALIDKLLEFPSQSASEAGEQLLQFLSENRLGRNEFVDDPLALIGPPYFASRYLAQVTLRALKGEYEALDEVMASLHSLVERNPPMIEPRRAAPQDASCCRKRRFSGSIILRKAKTECGGHPLKCW